MKCGRGFLMVRNMRTGDVKPFFLKVREQDIVWKDQAATRDDIVVNKVVSGWLCETHTLLNRITMSTHTSIPTLTMNSTRIGSATVTLPKAVTADTTCITISKYSKSNKIFENANIEAHLINVNDDGLSDTLQIDVISPLGEFTASTLAGASGMMDIMIAGFTE